MDWAMKFLPVGYRETERMIQEKGQVVARFCRCQKERRRSSWIRLLSPSLEILKHTEI